MHDVVDRLVGMIGSDKRPEFGALPDRPREQAKVANTLAAENRLGWRATTSLDNGLRQTVDWYRSVGRRIPPLLERGRQDDAHAA